MARAATAFVDFEGDFSRVQRSAGLQSKRLESTFGSSFRRIAGLATAAFAGIGIGKVLKDAFHQAEESQKVAKLTAAVLKSTGNAAKVSAPQVEKMANSLSALSGVDDEVIQSAENVLLTFTQIRNQVGAGNDIFTQASKAALNLSSALGTDLQGAVIQVGKALNDPIKGITALRRVGVSFTKEQIDQVKALVASGHAMDAQKLILHELTTEFGGAAEAAATPSKKLGVAIKNIEESLGGLILPLFEKLASFITVTAAPALERFTAIVKNLGTVAIIAFEIGFGGKSIAGIHGWLSAFAKLGALLRGFIDFIRGDVASAGVQLGKLFGLQEDDPRVNSMINALTIIRKALVTVAKFLQKNWKPVLIAAAAALLLFTSPIVAVAAALIVLYLRFKNVRIAFEKAVVGIQAAVATIRAIIEAIVSFIQSHAETFQKIGDQLTAVWDRLAPALKATFDAIVAVVRVALAIIITQVKIFVKVVSVFWDTFGHTILDVIRGVFTGIVKIVRGGLQIVQGIMEIVTGIFTGKWSKVWQGVKDIFAGIWNALAGIVMLAWTDIKTQVEAIKIGALRIIKSAKRLIHDAWFDAWHGLEAVVAGVWGGIERVIVSGINTVIGLVNGLINAFNRLPFVGNIPTVGTISLNAPKGSSTLPGAGNPSGTLKGRGRTPAVSVPTGTGGGGTGGVRPSIVFTGNIQAWDDRDLVRRLDEQVRRAEMLAGV